MSSLSGRIRRPVEGGKGTDLGEKGAAGGRTVPPDPEGGGRSGAERGGLFSFPGLRE